MFVSTLLLYLDDETAFGLSCLCLNDKVVIAMRAVLISLFEFFNLLAESALALLAQEDHFHGRHELVVIAPLLHVALRAVVPLFAAGCTNRDLRVEDVFAHFLDFSRLIKFKF